MLSSMGAVIYDSQDFYIIPLDKKIRRNVLGASDAFLGAFVVGMLRDDNMISRFALASSAASIVMESTCADFNLMPDEIMTRRQTIADRITIK